jgi:hypothetical protein
MLGPAFGNFRQIAWVTNDLDRSMAMFKETYRVPSFYTMDLAFDAQLRGQPGQMKIKVALANIDHVQIELIEPRGGIDAIYREVLPVNSDYANVFHHFCVTVKGTRQDWKNYVSALGPDRPVCYSAEISEGAQFVYTDERHLIGTYIEHVWFSADVERMLQEAVPRFLSDPR